ncbi:tetratricopeptide (TPR) repeat protein [Luteibacter sp. Sphag1AF]|uniref:tetratricopeptide repeat protein n=1 Tax=Luteibacter sp. Sphag1AF TaxID=2587031 RepID=UPI00160DF0A3|nr:tetratricopeptide repeat protein [Luteibacter sp. Sphag1AF]MBB3225975.1 tetratricopeptide (TPR) repeat protein [Luteibacter sp. Sphag1AF]
MGLIKKLFGKKAPVPQADAAALPEKTISVTDAYGRRLEVNREQWRTSILPHNFAQNLAKPDSLAGLIIDALNSGFAAEALEPARHLCQTDTNPRRGAVLLAVTLLDLKRFEEARAVLEEARVRLGDDVSLLTNLAKAHSGLGQDAQSASILWQAIECDPNFENALMWHAAMATEQGGEAAQRAFFARVAELPGSWRAQLWLARAALEAGDLPRAREIYGLVLARAIPVPADALQQISGDLGRNGHLELLLELVSPVFDVDRHGLAVGNNLIKANLDVGHIAQARRLLEALYRQQRPDWEEHLLYWDNAIATAEKRFGPVETETPLTVGLLKLEQPVWVREALDAGSLLPTRDANSPVVVFMAGSCTSPQSGDSVISQRTDALGRLSRGMPMYLAEQVLLRTSARTCYIQPWMKSGGFVLARMPWDVDGLRAAQIAGDYAVLSHVDSTVTPWHFHLDVIRMADQAVVASWQHELDVNDPSAAIRRSEDALVARLLDEPGLFATAVPGGLEPPDQNWLAHAVAAMEQGLAVSCASLDGVPEEFLFAERNIFNSMLQLCLQLPANARARLLLLGALHREAMRKPAIAAEYRDRVLLLQKEHPLTGVAGDVVEEATRRVVEAMAVDTSQVS